MINRPAGLDVPEIDIDPFSHAFLTMPYPDHERMRQAGPWVWLTQHGILATCRHAQVKAVLSDHVNFISSAGVGLANFNREAPFRPKSLILEAKFGKPSNKRLSNWWTACWSDAAAVG